MRMSKAVPLGLLLVGIGLASAVAFDGARTPGELAPTVNFDGAPRTAMTAAPVASPNNPPPPTTAVDLPPLGVEALRVPDPGFNMSPVDAFRWGAQALHFGNIASGVRALEFAAANGHPVAQWKLGRMYADGDGVKQDELRAFGYFREVANVHAEDTPGTGMAYIVANSFVSLGTYFLNGIPNSQVTADPARAREMFYYAATYFGDRDAQYQLARLYLDGTGVQRDPKFAARWLNLAADKGQHQAQALLGDMLFKGNDVPRRAALGLMWLTMARDSAASGDDWIVQMHDAAAKVATDDERAQALALLERRLKGEHEQNN
jgi:uncharacterized protein